MDVVLLDTTVLVYAVGAEHSLRRPSRSVLQAAGSDLRCTTTPEVIQEFVHVRSRRRSRGDAVRLGQGYADLLSPLIAVDEADLRAGMAIFERNERLGSFDAVLAAVGVRPKVSALVSGDRAFGGVEGLRHLDPSDPQFLEQLRTLS